LDVATCKGKNDTRNCGPDKLILARSKCMRRPNLKLFVDHSSATKPATTITKASAKTTLTTMNPAVQTYW
jgi:hypothetical protein